MISVLRSRLIALSFATLILRTGLQCHAQTGVAAGDTATTAAIPGRVFGFRDFSAQAVWDRQFLAVPDPALARQHLKALTSAPHWASSPEDYATALYVASHFKAAGLETEIVPYSVLLDKPVSVQVEAFDADGVKISSIEHTGNPASPSNDSADPRILPPFNSSSPSADITAPVVYANYGRQQDFHRLASLGVSVHGKIVLIRYGAIYRGVKAYIAQQFGAKGVLLYSDLADDADAAIAAYPAGPRRPDSAAQLGAVQFLPIYPGDPTTPGIASVPDLPSSSRIPTDKLQYDLPTIPVQPLSTADASPILRALGGPNAPEGWGGGIGSRYRLGGSAVTVHLHVTMDTRLRTIWDVIGRIPGASEPRSLVIAGNHRDAWSYGAADPGSGTAAMLEAAHGLGVLMQQGWRPRRTIVLASWDAEEEGMIGSTEWVEQHAAELTNAVAYFNTDVAVSGSEFHAAAVPSLNLFLRQIAAEVPSPAGGSVESQSGRALAQSATAASARIGLVPSELGSGSDYTPFFQHAGVPSTDIGSDGPFSVYHTPYDNYDWFVRFADPTFAYTQQQARFFGLEILHMADAGVLPFDHRDYARAILHYLDDARSRSAAVPMHLDFTAAFAASERFSAAADAVHRLQTQSPTDATALNRALSAAERALLLPDGIPHRPWFRHSIFAPGEYTGYEAAVIPGVNEAIDAADEPRARAQLAALTLALDRAAAVLHSAAP